MKYPLTLFLCVLFLPVYAFATVKINEVAWMGTAASQYSEWIELYNDGESAVDTVVPAPQNMDIQDPPAANKNNHIKIIIFGAVIFIGTALFLLLERFKAQQE
jgi:hypothetical protein